MPTWELPATPSAATQMRRHVLAFATETGVPQELLDDLALGVTEAVTNVITHAYAGRSPGPVLVRCRAEDDRFVVEVLDEGPGVIARDDSPGLGHGLAAIGAVAQTLEVAARTDRPGTVVTMSFGTAEPRSDAPGLEPLCAVALERVADVSCVDVVSGGVLRRAAAEVAGDASLTEWLGQAVPPAKPGTATWAALREGGPHLVVHDPTVPRSPGGTGERLGLTWWVSIPVDGPDGSPAALWGLGGREGGRPVPTQAQLTELVSEVSSARVRQAHQKPDADGPDDLRSGPAGPDDRR